MSSHPTPPIVAAAFVNQAWRRMEKKELESNLMSALIEDPEIDDTTNVAVNAYPGAKGADFRLELVGKLASQREVARAEEIVRVNTGTDVVIDNTLTVG